MRKVEKVADRFALFQKLWLPASASTQVPLSRKRRAIAGGMSGKVCARKARSSSEKRTLQLIHANLEMPRMLTTSLNPDGNKLFGKALIEQVNQPNTTVAFD
ncbi:MAG: hypothetical protein EA407_12545 [Rhodobacteraceae bacterium]|nr:MAG: hypothetical protein EA407_12545 [Paracoccaceae bacterium]